LSLIPTSGPLDWSRQNALVSYNAVTALEEIKDVIAETRSLTRKPFRMNLWVSTEDEGARTSDENGTLEPEFGLSGRLVRT
jgi:hypothetical protein